METTITIIERGKTVDMRVRFMNWHGKDYCDIRTFVTSGATGEPNLGGSDHLVVGNPFERRKAFWY